MLSWHHLLLCSLLICGLYLLFAFPLTTFAARSSSTTDLASAMTTAARRQASATPLESHVGTVLPGEQLWHGVSDYLFGANDASWAWSAQNMGNNPAIAATVKAADIPLIRTPLTETDAQARVRAVEQAGAHCLGILPLNLQEAQTIVQALGNQCLLYELGNEPDTSISATSYAGLWNQIVPALRHLDSQALFIGPVVAFPDLHYIQTFLQLAQSAGNPPDVVSWHMYPCTNQSASWCLSQGVNSYATAAQQVQGVIQQVLGHALPLAITEWNDNWTPIATPQEGDPAFMTRFTQDSLRTMMTAGITIATQFDLASNAGGGHLDMVTPATGQARPQLNAMAALIQATRTGTVPPPGSSPSPTPLPTQPILPIQPTLNQTQMNCLLDPTCWVQQAIANLAQSIAQGIMNLLTPLITWLIQNPANFISQTPPALTYQNATVQTVVQLALTVVDAALAVLVIVMGYTVMVGEQWGLSLSRIGDLLPRLALAFLAAHVSLWFIQWFIDFNNMLCLAIIQTTDLTILTQTVKSVLTFTIAQNGWLLFLLGLLLGGMTLLLGWQMLIRLAFLIFLISIAPLGLLCFALPYTQPWGKLWLSNFTTTVFVQFFQITTLSVGGMLVAHLFPATNALWQVLTLLVCSAVFFLVLHLPSMLRHWALSGVAAQAGAAATNAVGAVGSYALDVLPRLLALL